MKIHMVERLNLFVKGNADQTLHPVLSTQAKGIASQSYFQTYFKFFHLGEKYIFMNIFKPRSSPGQGFGCDCGFRGHDYQTPLQSFIPACCWPIV